MEEEADIALDLTPETFTPVPITTTKNSMREVRKPAEVSEDKPMISCLRNEKIVIRHIPKESGMITNPKHVFYGGMSENAVRVFTVPMLESNGQYANVLTNEEKVFLEEVMGLQYNALSIYKREDNFWDNYTVRLTKGESYLDLTNPDDYIKYKVLLSNKDFIAGSLEELQNNPKATFQYVLITANEEGKQSKLKLNATMEAYLEFGKIQTDADTLRTLIETIDGRPLSVNSKIDFLQTQANKLIQADAKLFLKTIQDPYLSTKVLIKKALETGVIAKRGNYLYLKQDNTPLCENNEEPTLSMAAKYLNSPKHQEVKLMIMAKSN